MNFYKRITIFGFILLMNFAGSLFAQEETQKDTLRFEFSKASLQLGVGDTVEVEIKVLDMNGEIFKMPFIMFASGTKARRAVEIIPRTSGPDGHVMAKVVAHRPGSFKLAARTVTVKRDDRQRASIPVEVAFPPLEKITFVDPPSKIYAGTHISLETQVFDVAGLERKGVKVKFSSNNPKIAAVDPFGNVTAHTKGSASFTAQVEGIKQNLDIRVVANPVAGLELQTNMQEARTGDVLQFTAMVRDKLGKTVDDAPVYFSVIGKPEEKLGPEPSAEVDQDGRFVAETPGYYTVMANSGSHSDRVTVQIEQRKYDLKIELVGHGEVLDVFTSDLWVWEGVDGRDYAVTGTWGANGDAYFWDVTDPANMKTIDTVRVDARTVNDVKISEDGRICVISREGASNRKNGFVILDVSDPHNVKQISTFDDGLTGGVHNIFIDNNHVYAVNNSVRYDIINIEDPAKPYRVGKFELGTPGHSVHDVWIEKGIAFSSNWHDGLQLVDVGGVTAGKPFRKFGETASPEISTPFMGGGSPENPLQFANYEYPSGWNHAAFPYFNEDTNKFYVLAGDEAFPYGLNGPREKKPEMAAGWIHFVDFSNPMSPKETARYEVPEAGSHNYWVEDGILYAAFYNGGLRVIDVSGDLMGDLYKQGREIGWFLPMHRDASIPNAPMVWGAQPHKGTIFLSDMNSGLWAVKLVPKKKKKTTGTN